MRPINLLPPEVARERSRRRRVLGFVGLGLAYVALLVVGVFYWNSRVDSAQAALERQQEINQSLNREIVALQDASDLQSDYLAKADLVRVALAQDVEWGIVLNDLARLLPPRVWVETFSGTIIPTAPSGIIGQVAFSGVGFDFPDISAWLRALDSEEFVGITGTWVSTASEGNVGGSDVVNFSSTAVLTPAAATGRADDLIPEVP